MTSAVTEIESECPQCHQRFKAWYRESINLSLGDMTEKDVERWSVKVCPECKVKIILDTLVVDEDGAWRVGDDEDEEQ